MLIEGDCLVIFGIDQKCERRDIGMYCAMSGIGEKSGSESAPLESLVDSQSTDTYRRHRRITG